MGNGLFFTFLLIYENQWHLVGALFLNIWSAFKNPAESFNFSN